MGILLYFLNSVYKRNNCIINVVMLYLYSCFFEDTLDQTETSECN